MRSIIPLLLMPLVAGCAHGELAAARELGDTAPALWTSDGTVRSLAAGRPAPGEPLELWAADHREVRVLHRDGSSERLWKAPPLTQILRLEAVDLDGDGDHEWIIVLRTAGIRSHVLDRGPDGWGWVGKGLSGFLRPVLGPDGRWQLYGQRSGGERPFWGSIFQVDGDPADRLEAGATLALGEDVSVYDFFWLPGGRLFVTDRSGYLSERDPRSPKAELWRSDERFVVRPLQLEGDYTNLMGEESGDKLLLTPPPTITRSGDGWSVVMTAGQPPPPVVLEHMNVLTGGELRVFRPANRGLEEVLRTPRLGAAALVGLPWHEQGYPSALAGLLWTRVTGGFAPEQSRVFLFDTVSGDLIDPATRAADVSAAPAGAEPAAPEPPAPEPLVASLPPEWLAGGLLSQGPGASAAEHRAWVEARWPGAARVEAVTIVGVPTCGVPELGRRLCEVEVSGAVERLQFVLGEDLWSPTQPGRTLLALLVPSSRAGLWLATVLLPQTDEARRALEGIGGPGPR